MPIQKESVSEIWDDFRKGGRRSATTAWHIQLAVDGIENVKIEDDRLYVEGSKMGYVIPLNGERDTREFRRLYCFLRSAARSSHRCS